MHYLTSLHFSAPASYWAPEALEGCAFALSAEVRVA